MSKIYIVFKTLTNVVTYLNCLNEAGKVDEE